MKGKNMATTNKTTVTIQRTTSDEGRPVWSIAAPDGANYYGRKVLEEVVYEVPAGYDVAESVSGYWLLYADGVGHYPVMSRARKGRRVLRLERQ